MTERRYKEDEVREIFSLVTSGKVSEPRTSVQRADGLSLADIQSIGREVGLSPELVARAAAQLDERPPEPLRSSLGMEIEVGRVLPIERNLTEREWAQLVAELRHTFKAQGRVSEHGELRAWSNGNLHVGVEPVERGYRVRLGTLKGDAPGINALGFTGLAVSAVTAASLLVAGELPQAFSIPSFFGAAGLGAFLTNWIRLPRWRKQRDQQFEHIADKVKAMMARNDE